jgi:hypothetical protein
MQRSTVSYFLEAARKPTDLPSQVESAHCVRDCVFGICMKRPHFPAILDPIEARATNIFITSDGTDCAI